MKRILVDDCLDDLDGQALLAAYEPHSDEDIEHWEAVDWDDLNPFGQSSTAALLDHMIYADPAERHRQAADRSLDFASLYDDRMRKRTDGERERKRAAYHRDPEKARAASRKSYHRDPEKARAASRERVRLHRLRKKGLA